VLVRARGPATAAAILRTLAEEFATPNRTAAFLSSFRTSYNAHASLASEKA
jgi:hypothetical protein